jgi:hypothetical protein
VQTSKFNVSYTPQIAGEYEIWVLCGNIVLNGGNPYAMTVLPGLITFLMCLFNQYFHIHAMHEFTTI